MARKDALLRLQQRLLSKRDALRRQLEIDIKLASTGSSANIGDNAFDGTQQEIASRIAALESRELRRIERAIEMIQHGCYGICDSCEQKIPVARLQAIPDTTLCVHCQQELEESGMSVEDYLADWEQVSDFESRTSQREWSLKDLDVDY